LKKSNKEYWRERSIQLEETLLNKGENYLVDLQEHYKIAERNLEKDISNWYIRFARNNNINLVEAKRFLNSNEIKELKWDINQYIKYGKENSLNNIWIKQLENASAKFHITRLEALKLQLQQEIEVLYGNQLDDIDKTMRNIYTEGYYHTAFEIQKGFNVGFNLISFSNNELDKIISKPWSTDGKNFSDRIWSNKEKLINTLHTELTQSVIRGTSPDKVIKNISNKLNVSKKNAGRLVMTESAYFASESRKDCLNDLGVEKYEIVSTLDLHTSEICRELDGKIFDMKDYEVGFTAPPFHPWCRTTTCPYFDDEFTLGEKRATRAIDGKTEYIDSNIKYPEWREKYIKDNPKVIVEENKIKNKSRDKKQYEKYKEVLRKSSPKSFDDFQNLKYNNSEEYELLKNKIHAEFVKKDFNELPSFHKNCSDLKTRKWYKWHDENIPNLLDKAQSIEIQARRAHELRNIYRAQARDLMKNQEARRELDIKHPNISFDELMQHKKLKYGLTDDEAYRDIVRSSQTTNKKYDKIAGIKEE
jgi:SPP1 gp7 family putative phage head morphogenesis protein